MVPLLRLGFGLDAFMSTATSLFAIIPTSFSGVIAHLRSKTCLPKLGIALGLGGAITSSLGVYAGSISPTWLIMLVAALVMSYSAYTMVRKAFGSSSRQSNRPGPDKAASSQEAAREEFVLSRGKLIGAFCIGLLAGAFSGYIGVGGGFIMVPLMTAWLGVSMRDAPGTARVAIIILAIPGVIGQAIYGHVDWLAGVSLCVGAIPGAALGARLAPRIPERGLRLLFAAVLVFAALALVLKEFDVM